MSDPFFWDVRGAMDIDSAALPRYLVDTVESLKSL